MITYKNELVVENGTLFYKTENGLEVASLKDVVVHYKTMQANLEWCIGKWATDEPHRVIDPQKVLFPLEYEEIPKSNKWIQ